MEAMRINTDLDTLVAYQIGDRYLFDLPPETEGSVGLAALRLADEAWLERKPHGETVVCSPAYRLGSSLPVAVRLGLCTVDGPAVEVGESDDLGPPHRRLRRSKR